MKNATIGIIGGSGMLGSAISGALVSDAAQQPNLWISNTTGHAPNLEQHGVHVTNDNQKLVDASDVILLCLPPARFSDMTLWAPDKLVISVMAGVTIKRLQTQTGTNRVVRAMSSPAAALGLAFSPWIANAGVTADDRSIVTALFNSCGKTDEVFDEEHIDHFTALTGPVPGFVAYFAQCMVDHATSQGIDAAVADRAMRQLFLASATMLASGDASPADHVQDMIDYDGTTAAGLTAMRNSPLSQSISEGLIAAVKKSQSM